MNNPYDVVYTVLITEKASNLTDKFNRYTLKVNPKANKIEIRQAVEAVFEGVKVGKVNVMNCLGKKKRMRGSRMGKRPDWKKALVTLKEGTIELL
jgi:large subunit ribosomal protein L23